MGGLWDVGKACLSLGGSYKDLCLKIFHFYPCVFTTCVVIFHTGGEGGNLSLKGKRINVLNRILRMLKK